MGLKDWDYERLSTLGRRSCIAAIVSVLFVYPLGPGVFVVTGALLGVNWAAERAWKRKWKAQLAADQKEIEEAMRS